MPDLDKISAPYLPDQILFNLIIEAIERIKNNTSESWYTQNQADRLTTWITELEKRNRSKNQSNIATSEDLNHARLQNV